MFNKMTPEISDLEKDVLKEDIDGNLLTSLGTKAISSRILNVLQYREELGDNYDHPLKNKHLINLYDTLLKKIVIGPEIIQYLDDPSPDRVVNAICTIKKTKHFGKATRTSSIGSKSYEVIESYLQEKGLGDELKKIQDKKTHVQTSFK